MSNSRHLRRALFVAFSGMVTLATWAQSSDVPTKKPTWTQVFQTADGSPLSVGDTLTLEGFPLTGDVYSEGMLNLIALRKDQRADEVTSSMDVRMQLLVTVEKNPDYTDYSPSENYDSLLVVKLEVGERDGSPNLQGLEPTLDSKTDDAYMDKSIHQITAVIQSIEVNSGAGYENTDELPKDMYLELSLGYSGLKSLTFNTPPELKIKRHGCSEVAGSDMAEVTWDQVTDAVDYQLEWCYVDNYGVDANLDLIFYSIPSLHYDLSKDATRIMTSATRYLLPIIYDRGVLVLRVRALGRDVGDPSLITYGPWSLAQTSGTLTTVPSSTYIVIDQDENHDPRKNWQITCSYAEEGRHKEVMTYADGTTRARQTVTWSSSLQVPIIKDDFYDAMGRAAVETMPVPMIKPVCEGDQLNDASQWAPIAYYENFNNAVDDNVSIGHPFTYKDLRSDLGTSCTAAGVPLDDDNGAEFYYNPISLANPSLLVEQSKFLPRADGYPYVQTEYMPDHTGRVKRKGGVGPEYQLGAAAPHATRFIYGAPEQVKLDRLFGSEAPYASQCQRNITIDANGQATATYLDGSGHTIATALFGASPSGTGMQDVTPLSGTVLSEDLFGGQPSNDCDHNHFDPLEGSFTYDEPVMVPADNALLMFSYSLVIPPFTDDCLQEGICYHCVYDLEVSVTDAECGNLIYQRSELVGAHHEDGSVVFDCGSEPDPSPWEFGTKHQDPPQADMTTGHYFVADANDPNSMAIDLKAGTYILHKKLKIHEAARDAYAADYASGEHLDGDCFDSEEEIAAQVAAAMDTSSCSMSCQECITALGTQADFVINGHGSAEEWQQLYDDCNAPCKEDSWCTIAYGNMLSDMRPNGQYAKYSWDVNQHVVAGDAASIFGPAVGPSILGVRKQQDMANFHPYLPAWKMPRFYPDDDPDQQFLPQYVNEDGSDARVYVSPVPGGYAPNVTNNAYVQDDGNGLFFTPPENLANVEDFLAAYLDHPEWAKSLVYLHPEYCYYKDCRQYGKVQPGQTMSSDDWDALLRGNNESTRRDENISGVHKAWVYYQSTLDPAQRSALMPPLGSYTGQTLDIGSIPGTPLDLYDTDPATLPAGTIWQPGDPYILNPTDPLGAAELARHYVQYFYNDVLPGDHYLSMPQFAAMLARCGGILPGGTWEPTCTDFGNGVDDVIQAKEWSILKAIYLAEKYRIQKRYADARLSANCDWCTGLNQCIGEEDHQGWRQFMKHNPVYSQTGPGPVSSQAPYYQTSCQPCAMMQWYWYDVLLHKVRRVTEPTPPDEALDPDYADQQLYLQTGTCPLALSWSGFLNQLMGLPHWKDGTVIDLPGLANAYIGVQNHLPGNLAPLATTWQATADADGTVTAVISMSGQDPCTMTLQPPAGFDWSTLQQIIHIDVLNPNGFFTLTATVLVDDNIQMVQIQGHLPCTNLIDLYHCSFPDHCDANALGVDLQTQLNAMVGTATHFDGNSYAVLPVDLPAVSNLFEPFGYIYANTPPDMEYSYNAGSFTLQLHDSHNYGGNLDPGHLDIVFTEWIDADGITVTMTASLLDQIAQFIHLRAEDNTSNGFVVDLLSADLLPMGTLHGTATWYPNINSSYPEPLGTCQQATTPACADGAHMLDDDLAAVVSERLLFHGQSGQFATWDGHMDLFASSMMTTNLSDLLGPMACPTCQEPPSQTPYSVFSSISGPVGNTWTLTFPMAEDSCDLTVDVHLDHGDTTTFYAVGIFTLHDEDPHHPGVFHQLQADLMRDDVAIGSVTITAHCLDFLECVPPCPDPITEYPYSMVDPNAPPPTECYQNWQIWHDWAVAFNASDWAHCHGGLTIEFSELTYDDFMALGLCGCLGGSAMDYQQAQNMSIFQPAEMTCSWSPPPLSLTAPWPLLHVDPTHPGALCATGLSPNDPCVQAYIHYRDAVTAFLAVPDHPTLDGGNAMSLVDFIRVGGCHCGDAFATTLLDAIITDTATQEQTIDWDLWFSGNLNGGFRKFCDPHGPCPPPSFTIPPPVTLSEPDPCVQGLLDNAALTTQHEWEEEQGRLRANFLQEYYSECMQTLETFTKRFKDEEHHYTLYYYDQAGNLIRTVPPEGVEQLNVGVPGDAASMANQVAIAHDRLYGTRSIFTQHRLSSEYTFNSLNNPVKQLLPDQDPMKVWDVALPNGLPQDITITSSQFIGGGTGFLCGFRPYGSAKRGYVFRTQDAGNTWQRCTGVLGARLNNSFFINSNAYAVGDRGIFLRSTNNGSAWDRPAMDSTNTALNLDELHDLRDLHFYSNTAGWIGGVTSTGGAVLRQTTNSGTSFAVQPTLFNTRFGGFHALTGWGNNLVAVGTTTDGANGLWATTTDCTVASPTWVESVSDSLLKAGGTAADLSCVAAGDGSNVWVGGTYGTLLRNKVTNITATNATPWRTIATHTTDDIKDLWFLDGENGIALFQLATPTSTELRYTNDGGCHWTVFCTEGHINAMFPYLTNSTEGFLIAVGNGGQWMQLVMHAGQAAGYIPYDAVTGSPDFVSVNGQLITGSPDKLQLFVGQSNGDLWRCPDGLAATPVFTHTTGEGLAPKAITRILLHAYSADQLNLVLLAGNASTNGDNNWCSATYVISSNTFTQNTTQPVSASHRCQAATLLSNHRALLFDRVAGSTSALDLSVASPSATATASTGPTAVVGTVPTAGTFDVKAMGAVAPGTTDVVLAGPAVAQSGTNLASLHTINSTSLTDVSWCNHVLAMRPLPLNDLVDGLTDGSMVACGDQGTFFEHPAGASTNVWRSVPTRFTARLEGVAKSSGTELVAVGAGGLAIHGTTSNPSAFAALTIPSSTDLHDVVLSGNATTVAGDGGTIYYSSDFTSAPFLPATSVNVEAIRGLARTANAGEVCAVGDHALVHRVIGTARMPVVDIFPTELADLQFDVNGDGYVCGNNSTLLHTPDGGLHWNMVPIAGATCVALRATAHDGLGKGLVAGTYLVSNIETPYFKSITGDGIDAVPTTPNLVHRARVADIKVNASGSALVVGCSYVGGNYVSMWIGRSEITDGSTWSASQIEGSTSLQMNTIFSWPRYQANDDYFVGQNDGKVLLVRYDSLANSFSTPYSASVVSSYGGSVRALWFHDLTNGLASISAGLGTDAGQMYHVTTTAVDHSGSWIPAQVTPAYHGTLLGQISVGHMTVNTIAFSDRTHGFFGGVYDGSPTWFARTVTDDAGLMSQRMWYDPLGRLVFSQNTKQHDPDSDPDTAYPADYGYSRYDPLGRVVEAGQVRDVNSTPFSSVLGANINGAYDPVAINEAQVDHFFNDVNNHRVQVISTYYDQDIGISNMPVHQDNLRLRVATSTYEEKWDGDPLTFDHASHYSYDIHGNVKDLVQDIPEMNEDAGMADRYNYPQRFKTLHYTYDLVSGNVNEVTYQPAQMDQWIHTYQYDADNRIIEAHAGANDLDLRKVARYFYYPHGPLQREELGDVLQGLDYAYTLQGWIKGMNSEALLPGNDMGGDGLISTPHSKIPVDAFGYSLTYNNSDYKALDPNWSSTIPTNFLSNPGGDLAAATTDLWNGNIAKSAFTLPPVHLWASGYGFEKPNYLSWVYQYDQLNRLLMARSTNLMDGHNDWSTIGSNLPTYLYRSEYTYDANGNITTGLRYDQFGIRYDVLRYYYHKHGNGKLVRNRLYHLVDQAPDNVVDPSDPADQGVADLAQDLSTAPGLDDPNINTAYNYAYDPLGNLVSDRREKIQAIDWTVAGKVSAVTHSIGSGLKNLAFGYGADGQRIRKDVLNGGDLKSRTYYIRDAQGNLMATYNYDAAVTFSLDERHLYGSDHIGLVQGGVKNLHGLTDLGTKAPPTTPAAGNFRYELKDHLGDVAVVLTGDAFSVDANNDGVIDFYAPKVIEYHGYEPFGCPLPGRNFDTAIPQYPSGYSGKRKVTEMYAADGSSYDFDARTQDSRIGRFMSIDPKHMTYPSLTPYAFVGNSPIKFIDPSGRTIIPTGTDGSVNSNESGISAGYLLSAFSQVFTEEKAPGMLEVIQSSWGYDSHGIGGWGNFANNSAQEAWLAAFNKAFDKITDENIKVMALGVQLNIVEGQTKFVYYPQNYLNHSGRRESTYATGTMDSRFDFTKPLFGVSINTDRPGDPKPKTGGQLVNNSGYLPIGLLNSQGQEVSTQPGVTQTLLMTSDNTYSMGSGCTTYNQLAGNYALEYATVANLASIAGFRSLATSSLAWDAESLQSDKAVKKVLDNVMQKNPLLQKGDRKALPPVLNPRQIR